MEGFDSKGKVQGLSGIWATLPNIYGIEHSFKIMASEQLGVSNITVSKDGSQLCISGGHGYIGTEKNMDITKGEGLEIRKRFEGYLEDIFPEAYKLAKENDSLDLMSCNRPCTADALPIIESIKAENGTLVANIGHNCGGYVVAPVMAWVVEQTLQGKSNVLKNAFNPNRSSINSAESERTL